MDEDLDTHICLTCQRTIIGLDNYVTHKRRECPMIWAKLQEQQQKLGEQLHHSVSGSSTEISGKSNDDHCDSNAPTCDASTRSTSGTDAALIHGESEAQQLGPDDFFLSLELQSSKIASIKKRDHCREDGISNSTLPVAAIDGGLSNLILTSDYRSHSDADEDLKNEADFASYGSGDYEADELIDDEDEDEESDDCPPRGHTGGKWKPGTRPEAGRWRMLQSRKGQKKSIQMVSCSNGSNSTLKPHCSPCGLTFRKDQELVKHLITQEHWLKSKDQPQHLEYIKKYADALISAASFTCNICYYYCNTVQEFVRHWTNDKNAEKLHSEHGDKGFICTCCDRIWETVCELAEHFRNGHNQDSYTDRKSMCVVVKSADHIRCPQCDWRGKRKQAFFAHQRFKHPKGKQQFTILQTPTKLAERRERTEKPAVVKIVSDLKSKIKNKPLEVVTSAKETFAVVLTQKLKKTKSKVENLAKEQRFSCESCCVSFARENLLAKHKRSLCHKISEDDKAPEKLSQDQQVFSCYLCSFKSISKAGLFFHLAIHSGHVVKDRTGDYCQQQSADHATELETTEGTKNSSSKQTLSINNGVMSNKLAKLYSCGICDQLFKLSALRRHLDFHTGEMPFKCRTCDEMFALKKSLHLHSQSVHEEKQFKCLQCSFRSSRKCRLNSHMETHKAERDRKFLCDTCGSKFFNRWSLNHHIKLHTGNKTHKCTSPGCNLSFRCPSELLYHSRVHTGERPFLCPTCGHKTKTRHQLTKHERTHTGSKPFKCPHCSFSAKLGPQLIRHLRIHTGVKPYSCPHCKYRCNTQENLRKHVLKSKKHQGLNVYKCPHCSYGCDWAHELKDHIGNSHDGEITANDVKDPAFSSVSCGIYDRNMDKNAGKEPISIVRERKKAKTDRNNVLEASEKSVTNAVDDRQSAKKAGKTRKRRIQLERPASSGGKKSNKSTSLSIPEEEPGVVVEDSAVAIVQSDAQCNLLETKGGSQDLTYYTIELPIDNADNITEISEGETILTDNQSDLSNAIILSLPSYNGYNGTCFLKWP